MTEQVPLLLYKYCRCNRYNEDIILGGEFYLSRPSTFNDPFDCRGPIRLEGTDEELRVFLRDRVLPLQDLPTEKVEPTLDKLFASGRANWYRSAEFAAQMTAKFREHMEVLCLSQVRDDIVMWSHYADHHRGVCFGFSTEHSDLLQSAEKVQYSMSFPVLNALRTNEKDIHRGFFGTKFITWKYEKEWRVVRAATEAQRYAFPPGTIKEVTFGSRISNDDQRRLILMLHFRGTQLQYFRAVEHPEEYKLQIIPLPLDDDMIRDALAGM
ncbi:MAG: DUF2971 domain-containing protein [Candidatus Latescibacterota bacterium]